MGSNHPQLKQLRIAPNVGDKTEREHLYKTETQTFKNFNIWYYVLAARNIARNTFNMLEPKPERVSVPYIIEDTGETGEWVFTEYAAMPEGFQVAELLKQWEEDINNV